MARDEDNLADRMVGGMFPVKPGQEYTAKVHLGTGSPPSEGWMPDDVWQGARMAEPDPEVKAMGVATDALEVLDEEGRARVLAYLVARFR